MRLTVLMCLAHWKLRAADVWTVAPDAPVAAQAASLLDTVAAYARPSAQFQA